jgi:hypothetical protein
MKYTVKVIEKEPVGESIMCFVRIFNQEGGQTIYPTSYFVCDLDKNITQYPNWLYSNRDYLRQVNKLGYKLGLKFQKSLSSND